MSINGVNQNTDIQKLLKLMKSNKGANVGMSKKVDARMTKEGSIFAKTVSSTSNNKSNVASTNNNVQARTIGNVQSDNVAKSISNVSLFNGSFIKSKTYFSLILMFLLLLQLLLLQKLKVQLLLIVVKI